MILTTCPLTSTHTSPFHICILVVAGKENSIIFFFFPPVLFGTRYRDIYINTRNSFQTAMQGIIIDSSEMFREWG